MDDTVEAARDGVTAGEGQCPGAVIGRGRTAEIHAWSDGQVVKIYEAWLSPHLVDHEVAGTKVAATAGAPAPAFGGRVTIEGRDGLVMERLDGVDMLARFRASPWRILSYAAELARVHADINARAGHGLEPLRERLASAIGSAGPLGDEQRAAALSALERLPDGDRLCHGDFHPGNVIFTSRGPVALDWMGATCGAPSADVARTSLILGIASIPHGRAWDRTLARVGRSLLRSTYVRRRLRAGDVDATSVRAWMLPVAAARLAEGIDDEREKLLELVALLSVDPCGLGRGR